MRRPTPPSCRITPDVCQVRQLSLDAITLTINSLGRLGICCTLRDRSVRAVAINDSSALRL
jgi:hypothetical protein